MNHDETPLFPADDDEPCCTECGKAWTDHLGIIGTCRELQHWQAEAAKWKAEAMKARQPPRSRPIVYLED